MALASLDPSATPTDLGGGEDDGQDWEASRGLPTIVIIASHLGATAAASPQGDVAADDAQLGANGSVELVTSLPVILIGFLVRGGAF
jgi:hypothetical protein